MRIDEYMNRNNYSQVQMAKKCNISPQLLQKYLNWDSVPRADKMKKIEKGTGGLVTVEDFYKSHESCTNCLHKFYIKSIQQTAIIIKNAIKEGFVECMQELKQE